MRRLGFLAAALLAAGATGCVAGPDADARWRGFGAGSDAASEYARAREAAARNGCTISGLTLVVGITSGIVGAMLASVGRLEGHDVRWSGLGLAIGGTALAGGSLGHRIHQGRVAAAWGERWDVPADVRDKVEAERAARERQKTAGVTPRDPPK